MSREITDVPPHDWTITDRGSKRASFMHETYELTVEIAPKYQSYRGRQHGTDPKAYRIQLKPDWFTKELYRDRHMAATVKTWDDALTTAREFMLEFSDEQETLSIEEVEATHRSVGDHETAEHLLTTEVAAEALADAAGYSDELLLSALETETNGQYQAIVHRDGDQTTIVNEKTPDIIESINLKAVYAAFPVDKTGIDALYPETNSLTMTIQLGEYTIYRFIFGVRTETDIILQRGTQVTSPAFERTMINILEEKW